MTLPSVYPVHVAQDSPVLAGLTLLDIPDRNPLLPPLYTYNGDHPYHRVRPEDRITYVYLVDPSPKGKAMAAAIANSMEVPSGPISGVLFLRDDYTGVPNLLCLGLRGVTQLRPGDALMGRSILANGDPNEDCLQLLGGIECVFFSSFLVMLTNILL